MKVLYLETEEEITSVIEKLKNVRDSDVVLVVPKRSNLTQSMVNLKLLRKHSLMSGKDVSLVASDPVALNLASRAGFRVKERVELKEEYKAPEVSYVPEDEKVVSKKEKYPIKSYKDIQKEKLGVKRSASVLKKKIPGKVDLVSQRAKIALSVVLVILIVVALYVYFFLPKATLRLVLKTDQVTNDAIFEVLRGQSKVDVSKNIIPGQLVSKEAEEKREFDATGEKNIGTKAKGEVTISNSFQTVPRAIPSGTKLESPGNVFITKQEVTVPGYIDTGGNKVPGKVNVKVEAAKGGTDGNIGPSKFIIASIEARAQKDIYAESAKSMQGGNDKMAKVVSKEDIEKAQHDLENSMKSKVAEEMNKEGKIVINDASKMEEIGKQISKQENDEAEKFEMALKDKIEFTAFLKEDMQAVANDDFTKVFNENKYFILNEGEDYTYELMDFNFDEDKMKVKVLDKQIIAEKLNTDKIIEDILGKSKEEVDDYLSQFPNIKEKNVEFWPFWVSSVPRSKQRVSIVFDF